MLLRVRLTPKGRRDNIDAVASSPEGSVLKLRERTAPEGGAANAALASLMAYRLDIASRDVTLAGCHKYRSKLLEIAGDPATIEARLLAATAKLESTSQKQPEYTGPPT